MKELNNRISLIRLIAFMLLWLFVSSQSVSAFSLLEQFTDPQDGKFDASNWLIHKKGFLPVPIIITEPAIGYGGGAALLFFHTKHDGKNPERAEINTGKSRITPPPSISGIVGLGTENGTWAAGGFHFGSWKQDSIRYTGGVIYPSVNLTFYGGGDSPILKNGLDYNLKGWFLFQEMVFRLKSSHFFLGPRFIYYNIDSTFDLKLPIEGLDPWQYNVKSYGIGLAAAYDSRDNIFTPNRGIRADISSLYFNVDNEFTGSRAYRITDVRTKVYWQLFSDIVLGWRLHGGFGDGDIPFYALPFIDLRGIPAMRYQGEKVLVTEIETRWNMTERWSFLFFGGVGRTADSASDFGDSTDRWAGGTGIRYLVARLLGLYTGVDIARGPEDWVFYIQVGSAWGR